MSEFDELVDYKTRLERIRAAAESDADLESLPGLRAFLLRETDFEEHPPNPVIRALQVLTVVAKQVSVPESLYREVRELARELGEPELVYGGRIPGSPLYNGRVVQTAPVSDVFSEREEPDDD